MGDGFPGPRDKKTGVGKSTPAKLLNKLPLLPVPLIYIIHVTRVHVVRVFVYPVFQQLETAFLVVGISVKLEQKFKRNAA